MIHNRETHELKQRLSGGYVLKVPRGTVAPSLVFTGGRIAQRSRLVVAPVIPIGRDAVARALESGAVVKLAFSERLRLGLDGSVADYYGLPQ